MEFYLIFISILQWLPPDKWVRLVRMVEGGSENNDFFTGVLWPMLQLLLINEAVFEYTMLYEEVILVIEGWDELINAHPYLQVFHQFF